VYSHGSIVPRNGDWPVNSAVEVRFEKMGIPGLKHFLMFIRRPDDKSREIITIVMHIYGPDGTDRCGIMKCG
jgi:hypothetical protein